LPRWISICPGMEAIIESLGECHFLSPCTHRRSAAHNPGQRTSRHQNDSGPRELSRRDARLLFRSGGRNRRTVSTLAQPTAACPLWPQWLWKNERPQCGRHPAAAQRGVAERMEAELGEEKWNFIEGCQGDWDRLPPPGPPLTVELDGGFTPRSRNPMARAGSKSSRARACQRKALRTALLTCRPRTQSRSDGCSN